MVKSGFHSAALFQGFPYVRQASVVKHRFKQSCLKGFVSMLGDIYCVIAFILKFVMATLAAFFCKSCAFKDFFKFFVCDRWHIRHNFTPSPCLLRKIVSDIFQNCKKKLHSLLTIYNYNSILEVKSCL